MARMWPREIREDTASDAERRLFLVLQSQLPAEWAVLHSLGLASHPHKPWAEIDFVLIGPSGVFCLEVKGGRVSRHGGVWTFTDRHGKTTSKVEGPFEQVGSASAALYARLQSALPWLDSVVVGYGAAFPDIVFDVAGPDIISELVYDSADVGRSFQAYMARMVAYWRNRLEAQRKRPVRTLDEKERKQVLDALRGDFDLRPSLATQAGYAEEELLQLTAEQKEALFGLADNPRVLVRGGAGTGKTVLAVEEARRLEKAGKSVFFCCFNKQLAYYLAAVLKDCVKIRVQHLHGFMKVIVDRAGLAGRLPPAEEQDLFQVFYPELCIEAMLDSPQFQSFDALIVDEAQDLLTGKYLEVFDSLVSDGLDKGQWRFFLDPFQDLYGRLGEDALARLLRFGPAQFQLRLNCRNTRPIALTTMMLSGLDCGLTLKVEGPKVREHWYTSEYELRQTVSDAVRALLQKGFEPGDIVILSRRRLENSGLREGLVDIKYPLKEIDYSATQSQRQALAFSTVAAFKGLDRKVVLLVDIEDLKDPEALRALYVGTSRAMTLLILFIHERARSDYRTKSRQLAEILVHDIDSE